VYAAIERVLGRLRTDCLIAVSASERHEIERLRYVDTSRLVRVDCGLDGAELLQAAGQPCSIPLPNGPLVVAAGRLDAQKDPRFLVRVSRELAVRRPDLRFVWVGDGALRDAVVRDLHAAGIADLWTLTGWLENPYPVIRRAAVVALPSRYESFGYVTLEAMMLGRPVVATNVTGSRDLVADGVTGHLVAPDDVQHFASALDAITSDPARAAAFSTAAVERARHFSRARMAEETRAAYAALTQS
jgi:glycosyltransferase involved in cell wall biosynthesis